MRAGGAGVRSRREAPASRLGSLALLVSKAPMPLALAVGESVTATAVAFTVGKLRVMGSPREALSEERSASGHPPRRRATPYLRVIHGLIYPREGERGSVAGTSPLHPRLRVEAPRRVAAPQQVVAGEGHLLAEEVEVVREAEVAS